MLGSAALRASVAPGGALAGPWVQNSLWTAARAVPSLDLRFADNKSLTDAVTNQNLVTFTRASNGTFVGSDGVLQTAATDVPRFDHNPTTGESLGLLVEEQRTNSVTNNTMVGAVAGTPGTNPTGWIYATTQSNGLTLSIAGIGVENGINYIDYRFNGTTVASPNACTISFANTTAATAQTWTASMYWKLAAGTATGVTSWQIGIIESTSGGGFVTGAFYTQTASTSAALITQRPAATRTLSGGATVGLVSCPLNINVAGNTAIDFTLRIGLPQLEQGAFATSPILTSTAAVTRSADVASITGSNFSSWYNQTEGTVFAEGNSYGFSASTFPTFAGISDGTANNRLQYAYIIQALGGYLVTSGGATVVEIYPNIAINPRRAAFAAAANNYAVSFNGASPAVDTAGNMPIGVNQMQIGNLLGAGAIGNFFGTIKRLTYWPTRLSNEVLQRITQ